MSRSNPMTHAAESTHYYTRAGVPAYTVTAKAGHERPTTVADARKLGLVPSVTAVINCSDKPGLNRWKLDQMLHAALTLPRRDGEPEAQWIERVWTDSKETARKAAERGTAIHAAIQEFFDNGAHQPGYEAYIQGAVMEVTNWLAGEWIAEKSFAHPLGFGGKIDLSCSLAVVDFKTKEFDLDTDLKTWPEHSMQLAAYRHGLEMPNARGAIVYVSVTNPGLCKLIEIPQEELTKGWRMFYSLLQFWKAKTGFESSFDRVAVAA